MIATVHDAVAPCNIYRSAPAMCQHQADLALPRSAATAACEQEEEQMLVNTTPAVLLPPPVSCTPTTLCIRLLKVIHTHPVSTRKTSPNSKNLAEPVAPYVAESSFEDTTLVLAQLPTPDTVALWAASPYRSGLRNAAIDEPPILTNLMYDTSKSPPPPSRLNPNCA
ncbi:Immunoglobulin A1 protease autotransporter [Dissostichus eleginoides]|uniref:Immunoglobulin A1 protease autotransporter n=1 Tax=Dissostichus eleginoides TaxID=100907 RepID=A0AAD9FP13_DISEL|nr:Immunoglobulin A1 protease autotransporter [Dissostichus eleginoides]